MSGTALLAIAIVGAAVYYLVNGTKETVLQKATKSPATVAVGTVAAILLSRRFGLFSEAKKTASDVGKVFTGEPTNPTPPPSSTSSTS